MQIAKASAQDAQTVKSWLLQRQMTGALADHLPHVGYIALDDDDPIAAGYLRLVEGGCAIIDSLITNPRAKSAQRHEAIDSIVKELISTAKNIGLRQLIAYCTDEGTLERSIKHGFKKIPYAMISLELKE